MRGLFLILATVSLAACNDGGNACEKAARTKLKGLEAPKILDITEQYTESGAFFTYYIAYKYGSREHGTKYGAFDCFYDNNDGSASLTKLSII